MFDQFALHERLLKAVAELKFVEPTPVQVAAINHAYAPTDADLVLARRIMAAFAANPGLGTIGIDGKMYDIPHLKRAERMLAERGVQWDSDR